MSASIDRRIISRTIRFLYVASGALGLWYNQPPKLPVIRPVAPDSLPWISRLCQKGILCVHQTAVTARAAHPAIYGGICHPDSGAWGTGALFEQH